MRLRGRLPTYYPILHGQNLRVFVDGRLAGSYSLEPGEFEVRFTAKSDAAMVLIEIRGSRWMVPKYYLQDSNDIRRLAYLVDGVEWETAAQPHRPAEALEEVAKVPKISVARALMISFVVSPDSVE